MCLRWSVRSGVDTRCGHGLRTLAWSKKWLENFNVEKEDFRNSQDWDRICEKIGSLWPQRFRSAIMVMIRAVETDGRECSHLSDFWVIVPGEVLE